MPAAHDGVLHGKSHTRVDSLMRWEPVLGHFAFNITAGTGLAQRLFRVGLLLLYNFDQPNARAAFQAALVSDASCAMCAWGLAHSYGPFLNIPTKSAEDLSKGLSAARNASRLLAARRLVHSAKERVLIDAMAVRYPSDTQAGDQLAAYRRYAARLRELRLSGGAQLREDPDLMVFDAEAMMVLMCDRSGYHFYTSRGDHLPPVEMNATREASALLRAALNATNQTHPYAQHLLIHSTEMSNAEAETAVSVAADLLKNMAGLQDQHLQHMTSHTFLRTGFYHQAVEANKEAVGSDAAYLHHGMVPYGPGHNSAFLVDSAMKGGERANAYKYAQVMQQIFTELPGRHDDPDGSMAWSYPMAVAVRFGDWDLVQQLDALPPGGFGKQWPYGYSVMRHFAMSVADANLGQLSQAEANLQVLRASFPDVEKLGDATLMNLTLIANHTASAVAAGARGDARGAVEALGLAVDVELSMPYNEPPAWPLPSRECYGQALLLAERPAEAEQTFRSALYGYSFHSEPRCGWALFGLQQSLQRQKATPARKKEIETLTHQLAEVWAHADVELSSPCLALGGARSPPWLV